MMQIVQSSETKIPFNDRIQEKLESMQGSKHYGKGTSLTSNYINLLDHVITIGTNIIIVHQMKQDFNYTIFLSLVEKTKLIYGGTCLIVLITSLQISQNEYNMLTTVQLQHTQTRVIISEKQSDALFKLHTILHEFGYYLYDHDGLCIMANES